MFNSSNNKPIILKSDAIVQQRKNELKERVKKLNSRGIEVSLATLLVGNDPASVKYVNNKHKDCEEIGIKSIREELPANITVEELTSAIRALNNDNDVTAYIVQLPLPKALTPCLTNILQRIDPDKDADGLTPYNLGKILLGQGKYYRDDNRLILPCTPAGIVDFLISSNISLAHRNICVIGRGLTSGKPLAAMLTNKQYNASVDVVHTGTFDLKEHLQKANMIISCAGNPWFIQPDWISKNTILVNVGVSRVFDETDNKYHMRGDFHPDCKNKALVWVPPVHGIGPMTRVKLMENTVSLAEKKLESNLFIR